MVEFRDDFEAGTVVGDDYKEFFYHWSGLRVKRSWWNMWKQEQVTGEKNMYSVDRHPYFLTEEISSLNLEEACVIDCLIHNRSDVFRFCELGAGWGRWTGFTHALCNLDDKPWKKKGFFGVAVEAEPTHYRWLLECISLNDISVAYALNIAVASHQGESSFFVGRPADWYGQCLTSAAPGHQSETTKVYMYRLRDITPITTSHGIETGFDLVHMDIQGTEAEVLSESKDLLKKGVLGDVIIGTHDGSHQTCIDILKKCDYNIVFEKGLNQPFTIKGVSGKEYKGKMRDGLIYGVKK